MARSQTCLRTITPESRYLDYFPSKINRALIFPVLPVKFWRGGLELLLNIIPIRRVCSWKSSQRVGAVLHDWTVIHVLAAKVGGAT